MNQTVNTKMILPQLRHMFPVPHARSFVTVVISTLALILVCLLFAPSSVTWAPCREACRSQRSSQLSAWASCWWFNREASTFRWRAASRSPSSYRPSPSARRQRSAAPGHPDRDHMRGPGRPAERHPGQRVQAQCHRRDHRRERSTRWGRIRLCRAACPKRQPPRWRQSPADRHSGFQTQFISRWPRCSWSHSS